MKWSVDLYGYVLIIAFYWFSWFRLQNITTMKRPWNDKEDDSSDDDSSSSDTESEAEDGPEKSKSSRKPSEGILVLFSILFCLPLWICFALKCQKDVSSYMDSFFDKT